MPRIDYKDRFLKINEEYIAYLYNVTKNKDWGTQEIHTQGLNINF